jgi:hypothetical protein
MTALETELFPNWLKFPSWLTWGLVLVALFPFVGGLMSILSEVLLGQKRRFARRKRNLILTGGILGIVGALWGAVEQARDTFRLEAISTGGEAYCYLQYELNTSSTMKFVAINSSEYPVYDVTFEVKDLTRWQEIQSQDPNFPVDATNPDNIFAWAKQTTTQLPLGNFRPREVRWVWDAPLPKVELQTYYVSIWARNGFLEEEILLHSGENGREATAARLWRRVPDGAGGKTKAEMLFEGASDEFKKYYPSSVPWTPNLTK